MIRHWRSPVLLLLLIAVVTLSWILPRKENSTLNLDENSIEGIRTNAVRIVEKNSRLLNPRSEDPGKFIEQLCFRRMRFKLSKHEVQVSYKSC